MKSPRADAFYVGYLTLPRSHQRSLTRFVPLLVGLVTMLAGVFAFAQRDPGDASWNTSQLREWTGVLHTIPYPVLIDDVDGSALLIVEQGKHGPRESAYAPGRQARLRGYPLERNGRRMIELDPTEMAVVIGTFAERQHALEVDDASGEFFGEILDAKCYLGAMKPGDGKAHKACATLCIQGGIPPMLHAVDAGGHHRTYVIVATTGRSPIPIVGPFIGEPVRICGRPARLADLDVLIVDTNSVSRP